VPIDTSLLKIVFHHIGKAFIHLLYPPSCLHCRFYLANPSHILCESCLQLMEPIHPSERCSICFSPESDPRLKLCKDCYQRPHFFDGIAAVFDFLGPPATLVKRLKYSNMPYLAESMAAYLITQFCRLDWPMPEVIVPISWTHLWDRGYNQSALLAQHFAQFIQCPVQEALCRKSGDFSQAGLNRSQRLLLEGEKFKCKEKMGLQNKTLLLIDDVITTGSTLKRCAEALQAFYPKKIYALAFCRAIR
jgi:competence protein ComFC